MSAKKKPKRPVEPRDTDVVIQAEHFHRMIDMVDRLLVKGLESYGSLREGVPSSGVLTVPEVLSDIAIKLHMMRHFVNIAPAVKR